MAALIYILVTLIASTAARYTSYQCEPVRMKMCNDLDPQNYVRTSFPNFMNHSSQDVAQRELSHYSGIIDSGCSSVLKMFLCTLYIPICKIGVGQRIPPCKSLCQAARSGCEPLLNSAHIRWPHSMDCDRFPDENSGDLCISQPETPPKKVNTDEVEIKDNQIPSKRTTIKKGKHFFTKLYSISRKSVFLNYSAFFFKENNPEPIVDIEGSYCLIKKMFSLDLLNQRCICSILGKAPTIAKKQLKPMQEVELKCNEDKQIMVRKVRHWPEQNTECCPVDTHEEISKRCNGKQNCEVILDKSILGAGCVATMKKTSVKYKCVSKLHDVSYRESIGCRKKTTNGI